MAHTHINPSDATLLQLLTADSRPTAKKVIGRDAALDPLMLAAAMASGPHMTRNHYTHDFFPGVQLPSLQPHVDWSRWSGTDASVAKDKEDKRTKAKLAYVSRQAPRRERLGLQESSNVGKENHTDHSRKHEHAKPRRHSVSAKAAAASILPPVEVKCMARTRIPTPHGAVFLHIYHNNRDDKEHLALVVDQAQFEDIDSSFPHAPPIRSASLDALWTPSETEADRLIRGAYVGRLSKTTQVASRPPTSPTPSTHYGLPAPLIRIHSECFTGETIGSMRCDCGEQLDEAIRQIAQPITVPGSDGDEMQIPGRGAVIYMRQEGRGIGLLSKIRAYNLQDMGHDTVTANIMLGHKADERGYEVAAEILRDLSLGASEGEGVRVLTNNPDKLQALEKENLKVVERVPMIPRSWQMNHAAQSTEPPATPPDMDIPGATMMGGHTVSGPDLDKYLRTKVLRMGHDLPLWMSNPVDV